MAKDVEKLEAELAQKDERIEELEAACAGGILVLHERNAEIAKWREVVQLSIDDWNGGCETSNFDILERLQERDLTLTKPEESK